MVFVNQDTHSHVANHDLSVAVHITPECAKPTISGSSIAVATVVVVVIDLAKVCELTDLVGIISRIEAATGREANPPARRNSDGARPAVKFTARDAGRC